MQQSQAQPDPFRTLIPNDQILRRIHELGAQVRRQLGDEPPCMVAVIEGARTFAGHLRSVIGASLPVHEVRASSYGDGTESSGQVRIQQVDEVVVRGRDVLILEDIVDTGRTVHSLRGHYLEQGARAVQVATLLSKPARRVVDVELEYVGFEIPDEFVIGFGMDHAGRFRDLDRVAVYESDRDF